MSKIEKLKQPLIDKDVHANSADNERHNSINDEPKKNRNTVRTFDDLDSTDTGTNKHFLELNKGVSWWNVSNIFVTYFVSIGQITFFDLTLVYLLKSADYYKIPENEIATVTGNIIAYSQPFTLVFDIVIGIMHDKIGRRLTLFLTTLVAVIAFLITPHLSSVIPGLLLMRIMLNFSIKGPLIAPLAVDYIQLSTRGRAVSLEGIGAG
jgi:MFS family permease